MRKAVGKLAELKSPLPALLASGQVSRIFTNPLLHELEFGAWNLAPKFRG